MRAHSSAVVLDGQQRGVEVMAKATRRRCTAAYKLRILREADACPEPGAIGAVLRRAGLYPSPLCLWRQQRRARELMGLAPARRGPAPKATNPLAAKVAALEKETWWLTARAERAEALVELQKKSQRSWGSHSRGTERRTDDGGGATANGGRARPRVRGPVRGARASTDGSSRRARGPGAHDSSPGPS